MPRSPTLTGPGGGPPPPAARPDLELARRVIAAESAAVAGLAHRLDDGFLRAVDLVVACADAGGTVLVTGLGKSGLIGAKISATLASLGVPSHPVHPTEAAHGDLGRFRRCDVCLALSYSGETDEVVALAGALRQDGVPVIAMTAGCRGERPSSLERLATATLAIGAVDDAAGLPPAPACSTTAMLALGDALALTASHRRNFTNDDFARRHPGGSLGGLLRPVTEALRFTVGKNLTPVPDDVSVAEALRLADTTTRRPGALLLVDRGTGVLSGIFTDADLRRLIQRRRDGDLDQPIDRLMTRDPSTLPESALVRDAVNMVREQRRDEIPVVDSAGRPVGLLDVQDLIAMRLVSE
ncbi:MAG TPA: SIS domain-containing protein [Phycisphaerales bacterium]|nr:SIS domain-containing protein [Phycisphaerales bacterium]